MKQYEISNTNSGHSFGLFEAINEEMALESMYIDAGYSSRAEAEEMAPTEEGEIIVELMYS